MGSIANGTEKGNMGQGGYRILPDLFLRTPWYSFSRYAPGQLGIVLGEPVFRNAIWLASPALYRELETRNFDIALLGEKHRHTLLKYFNRMCYRPVPFGLFAAFTLLRWGKGEPLELAGDNQSFLHLLPDQGMAQVPDGSEWLTANPTLYRLGREFRYLRSSPDEKGRYRFQIHALNGLAFYRSLLRLFRKGPLGETQVLENICRLGACSPAEGAQYLQFLLSQQVLFSSSRGTLLRPGRENARQPVFAFPHPGKFLSGGELLEEAAAAIKGTAAVPNDPTGHCFYAAAERPWLSGGPGAPESEELLAAVKALTRLSLPPVSTAIEQFKKDFKARFDQQQVPLLEALDPDAGVPFGSVQAYTPQQEWLDGVHFPDAPPAESSLDWTPVHRCLFRLLSSGAREPGEPLVIRAADLRDLPAPPMSVLPNTLALLFRRTTSGLQIEQAGGVSATGLTGRFTAFSEELTRCCRQLAQLEAEANPGILLADISVLSDLHVDNINRRRQIYPYEIPLNIASSLPPAQQLTPDDLLLSVRGDELVLTSRRHGRRVVPRLATAYNYTHHEWSLFRLLCELPGQGLRAALSLDPERFFPGMGFYPRVLFEQTVISTAAWQISPAEAGAFRGSGDSFDLPAFRSCYRLPRMVTMGLADQQLVFDLEEPAGAAFFAQQLRGSGAIRIREYLPPAGEERTAGQPLAGQYLAFLAHEQPVYRPHTPQPPTTRRNTIPRSYLLGSNWLYLKIYCTPATADRILSAVIPPILRQHRQHIAGWFFIRYSDPDHHLRLRIRTTEEHTGKMLADFRWKLEAGGYDRLLRDYQGGVYQRELERYGAERISLAEDVFEAGSDLCLWFLTARGKGGAVPPDLLLGLLIAKSMLETFIPLMRAQTALAARVSGQFLAEFKGDKKTRTGLDGKYRDLQKDIALLLGEPDRSNLPIPLQKHIKTITDRTRSVAYSAAALTHGEQEALLADLVHMQLNRLFSSGQRKQELLVWYCLHKYLRSKAAQAEKR